MYKRDCFLSRIEQDKKTNLLEKEFWKQHLSLCILAQRALRGK